MDSGTTVVVKEQRRDMWKLHPNQKKYPGHVIFMPSLPADAYSRDLYDQKGYKYTMQELSPGTPIVKTESGEKKFDISASDVVTQERKCPKCDRICVGEFGLQAHMKSHQEK